MVKLCQKNIRYAQDHKLQQSPPQQAHLASQEHTLDPPSFHSASIPQYSLPHNNPEAKAGKRVRKLKKKRVLRNAHESKHSDISDSELDASQASRPVRKLRPRRRTSGSCSSSPAAGETKEESMEITGAPETKGPTLAPAGKETQDSDSSELEMVELPQSVPTEVVNLDSSDPDEEERNSPLVSKESATEKTQTQNLACNEVTSTSEIDISVVTSCERYILMKFTAIVLSVFGLKKITCRLKAAKQSVSVMNCETAVFYNMQCLYVCSAKNLTLAVTKESKASSGRYL